MRKNRMITSFGEGFDIYRGSAFRDRVPVFLRSRRNQLALTRHLERGDVGTSRYVDSYALVSTARQVVMLQRATQTAGNDTHDGVGLRIETVVTSEYRCRD